jgi:hypothetical protein
MIVPQQLKCYFVSSYPWPLNGKIYTVYAIKNNLRLIIHFALFRRVCHDYFGGWGEVVPKNTVK